MVTGEKDFVLANIEKVSPLLSEEQYKYVA